MLVLANSRTDIIARIKDDPVRPHIPAQWRISDGGEVWSWFTEEAELGAVICVCYTQGIAQTEHQLMHSPEPDTAMFYTVWSYSRGSARHLVNSLAEHITRTRPHITTLATLSPLTEMAHRFHTQNGAVLVHRNDECQNFLYTPEPA